MNSKLPKKRYILRTPPPGNEGSPSSDLPDQTGQGGKFLKTDGANTSWQNVDGNIAHLAGISGTPSIAVGPGAGSGGSLGASLDTHATDLAGEITVTTGGSSTSSNDLCTVTFNAPYTNPPKVV